MKRLTGEGGRFWMCAALAAVFLASGALVGCSSDSGEDEPKRCEDSQECPDGFSCHEGICVESASLDGEGEAPPIEEEDYKVSFLGIRPSVGPDNPAQARLQIVSSTEAGSKELLTEEVEFEVKCASASHCAVTQNQEFLVVFQQGEDISEYDVFTAALDEETAKVVGSPQKILEGVFNPRLRGNGVIFDRVEQETYIGYYRDLSSNQDVKVATLAQVNSNPTQYWDADPVSDRAIVYVPTLESIDIRVGTISGGVSANNHIINFGRNNYPGDAGSFYIAQHPVGFSPDGRYVAVMMEGPVAHGACQSNSDCSGTSQICGTESRCVALEVAMHIIDMDNIVTLEDPCDSHDACGPVHRCDSPSANFQGGRCMPQLAVAGVPHFPAQGEQGMAGCNATRADGSYSFNELRGPYTFGPDGRFYMVGRRNCVKGTSTGDDTELNIARSSILALDIETGEFEEIFGNINGDDFEESRCYDEASMETVTDDCIIDIISAQLSPKGNDVVFLGSNPAVNTPELARQIHDVWRVRRDGEDHQWLGKSSIFFQGRSFMVHPVED